MYCWGDNASGQLGLQLPDPDKVVPVPTESACVPGSTVAHIAAGQRHSVFLTAGGAVLSCGGTAEDSWGGRYTGAPSLWDIKAERITFPAPIEALSGVVGLASGQNHCLAVCGSGQVYSWGQGSEGQLGIGGCKKGLLKPRIIQALGGIQICQVACGNYHSLALSRDGAVYSWGKNSVGQLGLGKGVPFKLIPSQVVSISGAPVTRVCAGAEHSFAISLSGAVYAWGANNAGQLGINRVDETGRFNPCPVAALKLLGVSSVSCGDAHTAVLAKDGSVYTFGDGTYGQLGHNSTARELRPRKVEAIRERASQVQCGSNHTLVYLPSSGLLLGFGRSTEGQTGTGSTANQLQPSPVLLPGSSERADTAEEGDFNSRQITVFTGHNASFILTGPSKHPTGAGGLLKIDTQTLQKWLTVEFGSKQWKEAKSEIGEICSSASCLIASFLSDSTEALDGGRAHYFGVDVEAARDVFRQLQKKHWIITQMTTSFKDKLIPSLQSPAPNVEALEVFLILPEISVFHEEKNIPDLILPLSSAIANLSDASSKILRTWWTMLPVSHMNKILQMFRRVISCKLKGLIKSMRDHLLLKDVLQNMKLLFKANKQVKFLLPVSAFYMDEVVPFVPIVVDMLSWRFYQQEDLSTDVHSPVILCRFPFALNLLAKVQMLHVDAQLRNLGHIDFHNPVVIQNLIRRAHNLPPLPVFRLQVRRTHLSADALRRIDLAEDRDFRKQLMVQFPDKQNQDQRGIQREFFCRICSEMLQLESGMFWHNESSTAIWFPTKPSVEKKRYFLFGILCGLVVFNYNTVRLPFPLALFKKLVDVKPTLEDLKELEPVLGKSLQDLLDYSGEDVEESLSLTFSVSWDGMEVDLVPDGKSKRVNKSNRREFVNACVDYVFNTSVRALFEEFRRGFLKVCDFEILSFFQPQEIMEAMTGTTDYDWHKLKQSALYEGGYHADHPTIVTFWRVFLDLTTAQKKSFLVFLTGSDRIPILGIDCLKMTVMPLSSSTEEHLPEVNVCFLQLLLPGYSTEDTMRRKLLQALPHSSGSWKT
ncbi:probable E3 ubiquitin-protein ligase HERC6 [Amia ocellicauda]|uniref:probable E3 ubiquitin-protein ligase HERC6 n=1 Tax=Amia ocellicauda TaxID=2972642 RepID=UPI0034638FCD